MKKGIMVSFLLAVLIAALTPCPAQAGAVEKLGRGITNVATFPAEVIVHPLRYASIDDKPMLAPTAGLITGISFSVLRLIAGVYDIVTFPIPIPRHYRSIMHPDTIYQSFNALMRTKEDFPEYGLGSGIHDVKERRLKYFR